MYISIRTGRPAWPVCAMEPAESTLDSLHLSKRSSTVTCGKSDAAMTICAVLLTVDCHAHGSAAILARTILCAPAPWHTKGSAV